MEYPNRYISYWKENDNGEVVGNIVTRVLCLKHREELMDLGYVLRSYMIADGWPCGRCQEEKVFENAGCPKRVYVSSPKPPGGSLGLSTTFQNPGSLSTASS